MLVRPVVVEDDYLILPATMRLPDTRFVQIPGCWLVAPRLHAIHPYDMPENWFSLVARSMAQLDLAPPHNVNLSMNLGELAGQSVAHLHEWIIDRDTFNDSLTPQARKLGLAGLLVLLSQHDLLVA